MNASQKQPQKNRFNKNWAKWMMESAYRWEDLSDVIMRTGIDMVDDDHRVLVEYAIEFNRLFDFADDKGFDLAFVNALEKLFAQLFSFTQEHFKREQGLIKRLGIPGIGKQRREHKRILTMLEDYMAEMKSGRLNIALNFKSTFMEWLANHINLIDFETFRLDSISPIVISKAQKWEDTADLIRSMGIDQMDEDHRTITEYALEMNQLMDAEESGVLAEVPEPLIELLTKLHRFTREHFEREETLMDKYKLKEREKQHSEHQWFVAELGHSINDLKEGKQLHLRSLKNGILEWWVKHINVLDYASFKEEDWAIHILEQASSWDDISEMVQPMNIESIDEQHRIQTEYILDLTSLIQLNDTEEYDPQIIQQIIAQAEKIYHFAEKHFDHEEKIMRKIDAPNQTFHVSAHKDLLVKIREYIDSVQAGKMMVSMKLKVLFADWWINHINHTDYRSFRDNRPALTFHAMPDDQT